MKGTCILNKKKGFFEFTESELNITLDFTAEKYKDFIDKYYDNKEKNDLNQQQIIKCIDDNNNKIYFYDLYGRPIRYKYPGFSFHKPLRVNLTFLPSFYINALGIKVNIKYISISFKFDELDYFVNPRRFYKPENYSFWDEDDKQWVIKASQGTERIFKVIYYGEDIAIEFHPQVYETLFVNTPFKFTSYISVEFSEPKSPDEIYKFILQLNSFFNILFDRQNIIIDEITLKENKVDVANLSTLFIIKRINNKRFKNEQEKKKVIPLELIENSLEKAFQQYFSNTHIYLGYLREHEEDNIVSPAKFLMNTSTFEALFNEIYPEYVIEHSKEVEAFFSELKKFLNEYEGGKRVKKRIKEIEEYISSKSRKSLEDRMKKAFEDFPFLLCVIDKSINITKDMDEYINYVNVVIQRICDTRNIFAHGKKEFYDIGIYISDYLLLRIINLTLLLSYLGFDRSIIIKSISTLHELYIDEKLIDTYKQRLHLSKK